MANYRENCRPLLLLMFFFLSFASVLVPLVVEKPLSSDAPTTKYEGVRDFAAYWASARLLLTGRNPYAPAELFVLQKGVGLKETSPLVMWNPPWTFAFTLPFGVLDFEAGQFIWLSLRVSLLILAASLLWKIYAIDNQYSWLSILLTLSFVPSWFVLILGQITPIVLAGLVGFLYFERQRRDFFAGAALLFISVKPHIAYLFWPVLGLWVFHGRKWRLLGGAAIVGAILASYPLLYNSSVYPQYLELFRRTDLTLPLELPAPSLRNVARYLLHFELREGEYLIPIVGFSWCVCFWFRHRNNWDWGARLPLLLLVSLVTSPYGWTFDQIIFLPAIMQGAVWVRQTSAPWYRSVSVLLFIAINVLHLTMRSIVAEELYYSWLAPAYLLNYIIWIGESRRDGRALLSAP